MKHDQVGSTLPKSITCRQVKLNGVSRRYDPRVCAIRPDLADVALAEYYFAPHYAAALPRTCAVSSAMLRSAPNDEAVAVSELLHGEAFHILDVRAGWAWGYCGHDHYVGYVPLDSIGDPAAPDHVATSVAPLFAAADIKAPVKALYPAHARLTGTIKGDFLCTATGFVHRRHVRSLDQSESDWVAVAQRHVDAPYVWGGRGGLGLDCSGLVQVSLAACGIVAPRDTDQQAEAIGEALSDDAPLQRGDVIFFPGHVGLMVDAERLIHANAHWMAVTVEPLADVVERLAPAHAQPITARRRIAP